MTEAVQVAILVSIPATIGSIANLILSLKQRVKIDAIHEATNGMQATLIAQTKTISYAEGMAQQREDEKKGP